MTDRTLPRQIRKVAEFFGRVREVGPCTSPIVHRYTKALPYGKDRHRAGR